MRLLVGVDGSARSLKALEETAIRAQKTGDTVTVVVYTTEEGRSVEAVEAQIRSVLSDVDCEATVDRIGGEPGSQLVERAETGDHDRIVLAGWKESPLGKIQLDSVVEFVLLNARTSVTLVR